jgi:hypothetical protein
MPCVYLPGPAPAVTVANNYEQKPGVSFVVTALPVLFLYVPAYEYLTEFGFHKIRHEILIKFSNFP